MIDEGLAKEIRQQNAALRAWRDCGIPIEGRWVLVPSGPTKRWDLAVRCLRCGVRGDTWLWAHGPSYQGSARQATESAIRDTWSRRCNHLRGPILDSFPPPEFDALARLALLEEPAP